MKLNLAALRDTLGYQIALLGAVLIALVNSRKKKA